MTAQPRRGVRSMEKILVVEDHEPEMRLMVWLLTDDGSQVNVTSSVGEVIADIERHQPDTVVFNSRMRGQAKEACINLIRELSPHVRIIDVSTPPLAAERHLIDITNHDSGDGQRSTVNDETLSGENLIYMTHHRRSTG
jgi:CheY-like chemotaxis protein